MGYGRYAGGYQASGETGWEADVIEGDIYTYLDSTLGMEMEGRACEICGERDSTGVA